MNRKSNILYASMFLHKVSQRIKPSNNILAIHSASKIRVDVLVPFLWETLRDKI